jgi:hypothetical protein
MVITSSAGRCSLTTLVPPGAGRGRVPWWAEAAAAPPLISGAETADRDAVLVTNHVLAGAVIGALVRKPLPALALGVISHVAMDVIPHWGLPHGLAEPEKDAHFLRIARRDGLAGLAAMGAAFGVAKGRRLPVLAGMVGAALLDVDKPARHFFGRSPFPKAVDRFHTNIQRERPYKMPQEFAAAAGLALTVAALCAGRTRP